MNEFKTRDRSSDLDTIAKELPDNHDTLSESTFKLDRTCIPTVSQENQETGLQMLDIEVYEQETLEKEILNQVDRAFKIQVQEKVEIVKSVQTQGNHKTTCVQQNDTNGKVNNNVPVGSNYEQLQETDRERKIRLGEMTPFGTLVTLKSVERTNLETIENYLEKQIKMNKVQKGTKRKQISQQSVDTNSLLMKKEFLKKKKRLKKLPLEKCMSEEICYFKCSRGKLTPEKNTADFSSGSEFVPTESDLEESDVEMNLKLNKNKNKIQKFSKSIRKYKKLKKTHSSSENSEKESKGQKEVDDGNEINYLKRLEDWEKINNKTNIAVQLKNIDNGFKMPLNVWNKLFNYQKVGVQWLWELNLQRCGGILGDEMGLGKTIQVIAFLIGLKVSKIVSKHGFFKGLGPVLIVCPTTVMHQWVREFHEWWPQFRVALLHESGTHHGKKQSLIRDMVRDNGILITSYVTCIQQSDNLLRYNWHYVILDEGHKIRNPDSQIASTTKLLKTPHRLILSGSPMQNNLKELWALFDFIFPGKLGTLPVFMAQFAVPITQGGYANASKVQIATAYKCATVLRDTISPYLLRRVKEDVKNHINLPSKNEQVLFCRLTEEQKQLYISYLNSETIHDILSGRYKIFVGLMELRKICNHPHLYTGGPKLFKWDDPSSVPEEERFGYWKKAGKMIVVETLLKMWKKQGHRVLIFTQSRQMLKILEAFVQSQRYEYIKIDGSTNIAIRQPLIHKFNKDKKYYIFLSTTQVGGLGVNLTGANRVVIYDPDWNPATDTQARERAWRIGQENQVTIYRLITSGTIEEKIYHRQIFKQFLTNKVLKDPNQRRFFKSNDLYELFTYKDADNLSETSAIFAGANLEVNLKSLSHQEKIRKIKSKIPIESSSVKKQAYDNNILTKDKIEEMKKMARNLSRIISMEISGKGSKKSNITLNYPQNKGIIKSPQNEVLKNLEPGNDAYFNNISEFERVEKRKMHRRKKKKDAMFDGEVVSHLQKQAPYKEVTEEKQEGIHEADDDYILKKLLSKSGVQSALKHDQIMDGGPADYALIEVEAEKVAKEAVKALKESRKHYVRGFEGQVSSRPRFGRKKSTQVDVGVGKESSDKKSVPMSSAELLHRIQQRNLLNPAISDSSNSPLNEHSELLTDIRNFISFGCGRENRASTQEIINKFRDSLPTSQTPLFKALLNEICEFNRTSNGEGIWELRSEFCW